MRRGAIRFAGHRCGGALPFTPEEESIDDLLGDDEEPDPLTPGDLWFRAASGGAAGASYTRPIDETRRRAASGHARRHSARRENGNLHG